MVREIRFWLFIVIIGWAIRLIPKDATKTWEWVSKMPLEK